MDFYCVTYGGGIHMIDLMRWLVQHEVTEVNGMSNKILTRDTPFKFDDTIINLLKFENGTIGRTTSNLGACRSQLHGLAIYGTKKTYINDLPHAKIFHGDTENDLEIVKTPYPGVEKFDLLPNFISAIRENKEPDVSAVDIFRVMDVCFACFESLEAKKTMPVTYLI